ncbi:uncharacterized protein F21D5.5 [Prorops nasuta]|uniref:uncharacterized protein F21D5.5 n=1 Tax=Prorops nasuta TaxID=863751 RepID=UPI0034CEAB45
MNAPASSCYLKSEDDSLKTIYLPDCIPTVVGRSIETNISDTKCSKEQVRLCANYSEYKVIVQQIGKRNSGINGCKTKTEINFTVNHDDNLEILYGQYIYKIEFNPPPEKKVNTSSNRKRSYVEDDDMEKQSCLYKINKTDKKTKIDQDSGQENNIALKNTFKLAHHNDKAEWESLQDGLFIYTSECIKHQVKIAAYDMDGTLIKTKSGYVFPKDCQDWQILYPNIPKKLQQLYGEEYKIVIFTNQSNIGSGKTKVSDFKTKIENIVKKINVPIQVFVASKRNLYRKPLPGMWNTLVNLKNGGLSIDKANSFYIGDAAGREKNWAPGKKKDHSLADRLLAINIDIKFETPEEHFLGHKKAPYKLPLFNPRALKTDIDLYYPTNSPITSNEQEVIIMVGCPGSGKSHFAKIHLKSYEHVNRDTLGNWKKCVVAMEQHLKNKKSVVVDNTNPDPATRKTSIDIIKKYNVPVRCFVMTTSLDHIKHNVKFRHLTDPTHSEIHDVIIHSFMKNYVAPSLDEGFKEIISVNFIPHFLKDEDRTLYEMYLLEH